MMRKFRYIAVVATFAASSIVMLEGSANAVTSTYANESEMINAGAVNPDIHDIYNRAERMLPAPVGQYNTRSDLLDQASYYATKGFTRNFLTWAQIVDVPQSFWSGRLWAACVTTDANGVSTPNRNMTFAGLETYTGVPCPDRDPQWFSPIDRSVGGGTVRLMLAGDAFIGMACGNFSPTPGDVIPPRITGSKFDDLNANGHRDPGEPVISNWPMTITYQGAVVWSGQTGADGTFRFDLDADADPRLGYGTYTVTEATRASLGWHASTGTTRTVTVAENDLRPEYATAPFGNYRDATLSGVKFEDMLADGPDATDPGLGGWQIVASGTAGTYATSTGPDGTYRLDGLRPGTYTVSETAQAGWEQSFPPTSTYTITLQSGDDVSGIDFGNFRRGAIEGDKFHDIAVDAVYDPGDPGVPGWPIAVAGSDSTANMTTGPDGRYVVEGLRPGVYTVTEGEQEGWRQTYPTDGSYTVTVRSGQTVSGVDFGNVCLGNVSISLHDVTGGPIDTDFDVRLEEISVPGVLQNDPPLPIDTTGGEITGLLPGTYRLTVFLDDDTYTTDPDVTVVDGRFAVVKTITVLNCDTTVIVIDTLTESSGFVTGGVLEDINDVTSTAGFNIKTTKDGTPQGVLEFVEHAEGGGLNLHTDMFDGIYVAEPEAWAWGWISVDGELVRFGLHLVDAGEPGRQDRFELRLATGYQSGIDITLTGGNVQLHVER